MWQFAFNVLWKHVGKTQLSVKHHVEGDQTYYRTHRGGHCRTGQLFICSHQGSQLWYKEPHKQEIIVRYACPHLPPRLVGKSLFTERRTESLLGFFNSCYVASYVMPAGHQTDQVPCCSAWDLEKQRAVKGFDPFTQSSRRQDGRASCGYERRLEDKISGKMISWFMQRQLLSHLHVNIWVCFT